MRTSREYRWSVWSGWSRWAVGRFLLFFALWGLVVYLSRADADFALENEQTFAEWEVNPFASVLGTTVGVGKIFSLKSALLSYSLLVSFVLLVIHPPSHRYVWLITWIALLTHLFVYTQIIHARTLLRDLDRDDGVGQLANP